MAKEKFQLDLTGKSYEEILDIATGKGMKTSKLNEAMEGYGVPENTNCTVVKVELAGEIDGDSNTVHLRIVFDNGMLSLGNLINSAVFKTPKGDEWTPEELTKHITTGSQKGKPSEGKLFLSGTRLNPGLPADQAKASLLFTPGKVFKFAKKAGWILPYEADNAGKPVFCDTVQDVIDRLKLKNFYEMKS